MSMTCCLISHADKFDISKVPEQLRFLVDQISESPLWAVGKCRNIVICRRDNSFFKMDPQVIDTDCGNNVFSISLLSNSVYTFIPPGEFDRT